MKTIRAKVSQRLLKKAHLLFNQTDKTLIHELLQNSRRAGASKVEITLTPSGDGTGVTLSDNGRGIKDPADLINLGESAWSEETAGLESPAGMGFFSLCHLPEGVNVHSGDWRIKIEPHTFQGESDCEVIPARHINGTSLSFFLPTNIGSMEKVVRECLRFYPILTTLNRDEVPREDFLGKAIYVHSFPGGRVGIYEDRLSSFAEKINFYGLTLTGSGTSLTENADNGDCEIDGSFDVKVDIESNEALDLVLPARNRIAENRKLEDLRTTCRIAAYRYIIATGGRHRLPHACYVEAHRLGINLPEAAAELRLVMPSNLHESDSDWSGTVAPNYQTVEWAQRLHYPVDEDSIISELENADIAALHLSRQTLPMLLEADRRFKGYSWYPTRTANKLVQVITMGNGKIHREPTEGSFNRLWRLSNEKKANHPKDIKLELTVEKYGQSKTLKFPTLIAFDGDTEDEDGIEGGWLPKRGKEAAKHIDSGTLQALFFSDRSDSDSDSYSTQLDEFMTHAEAKLVAVFANRRLAAIFAAEAVLNKWEVRNALQGLRSDRVILEIKDGEVKIVTKKN
jgi:hypothetical protein